MSVDAKSTASGFNRPSNTGAGARLAFLELFIASTAEDRLHSLAPDVLYRQCDELYQLGRRRQPGQTLVRSQSNGLSSVIEIVTDDMPYIVEGMVALLSAHDAVIHDLTHPIIPAVRDEDGIMRHLARDGRAESFVRIETDDFDSQALLALESEIGTLLNMLRRMESDRQALCDARMGMAAAVMDEAGALLNWLRDDVFTALGGLEVRITTDGGVQVDSRLGLMHSLDCAALLGHLASIPGLSADKSMPLRTGRLPWASPLRAQRGVDCLAAWHDLPEGGARMLVLVGHFTVAAQTTSPRQMPVLAQRVNQVVDILGFVPSSHNARSAIAVLEQTPRHELLALSAQDLADMVRRLLELQNKQRIDVALRSDAFGQVVAVQVLLPSTRMSKSLPSRLRAVISGALGQPVLAMAAPMPRGSLTTLEFDCALAVGTDEVSVLEKLKTEVKSVLRSWRDRLHDTLSTHSRLPLWPRYENAFPAEYQERTDVAEACRDIVSLEDALGAGIAVRLVSGPGLRVKVFHSGAPVQLYRVLPILENMGGRIIGEHSVKLSPAGQAPVWVHDITIELEQVKADLDSATIEESFSRLFLDLWSGIRENDGLNRLLFAAGLDGAQITILRAYSRYLRQIAPSMGIRTVERALPAYPQVAATLARLFREKFDPALRHDRVASQDALRKVLAGALDAVVVSDDDRTLRALANLIDATLRTNAFQTLACGAPKPYLSFKFDCAAIEELPSPRPFAEIFVYSPRMEGIHLRGAKIARGGLRWSDRRDDFRTEVLGLLKAQMVKNAVIVPAGSKGGFVVKSVLADRQAQQAEGVACYQMLIRGLLDLTDNLVDGQVVPPADTVRHDGDDPYLVVAADKGTATFSDIANALSAEYGFWLGDAFASGGSAGYDHKVMGITTRGAWEAIKRHFREMGRDIQSEPFTLAGVGDMSGDVFGNGMLQSPHTKLVAAFNHQFIFLDPAPDMAASLAERRRLFALPRSNWDDYDPSVISAGGGVFRRDAKRITLSPQAQALLGLDQPNPSPEMVIKAILTAPVDLLFFGGIGTYVRAGHETDIAVGDRSNDAIRVSAEQLRCKVVGEGANLAMTQAARIQFASQGGRLNTDAVDNSAGVDCSDHEVNIKILLAAALSRGRLSADRREPMLAVMTDDVAALVLRDNILQTGTLSVMERAGIERLDRHTRLLHFLEQTCGLDRMMETLPSDVVLAQLHGQGRGLTRPELAVLLAYGKNWLTEVVLASDLSADRSLNGDLAAYFPDLLQSEFADLIPAHPLAREILATLLANEAANRLDPATILHLCDETGHDAAAVIRAYVAVRDSLGLGAFWRQLESGRLGLTASAEAELMDQAAKVAERSMVRLLDLHGGGFALASTIAAHAALLPALRAVVDDTPDVTEGELGQRLRDRQSQLESHGIDTALARQAAHLELTPAILDIRAILDQVPQATETETCRLYLRSGSRFGLEWLRGTAGRLSVKTSWQRRAVTDLVDDLNGHQRRLTAEIIHLAAQAPAPDALDLWVRQCGDGIGKLDRLMAEIRAADSLDLSMLSVANRAIARLSA